MLKTKIFIFIILASIISWSCQEENTVLPKVTVQIEYSSTYSGLSAANIKVYAINTATTQKDSAITDSKGMAIFENMAIGTYNFWTSINLTKEEAGSLNGIYKALTLNAVHNNYIINFGITNEVIMKLDGKPSADLVIKEIYYNGAKFAASGVLFKDQFLEIFNNSDDTIYADSLYIANLAPAAAGNDPEKSPPLGLELTQTVYADRIAMVPGNGSDHPIAPGESIVICFNAMDFTEGKENLLKYTCNHNTADFETYAVDFLENIGLEGNPWFDIDNPDVPNMEIVWMPAQSGLFFLYQPYGASVVIFRDKEYTAENILDPNSSPQTPMYYAKIKTETIIDGIDCLANADAAAYKRLPSIIDAGFSFIEGNYTSQSVRRKIAATVDGRIVLKDTNNSLEDMEITSSPSPRAFN